MECPKILNRFLLDKYVEYRYKREIGSLCDLDKEAWSTNAILRLYLHISTDFNILSAKSNILSYPTECTQYEIEYVKVCLQHGYFSLLTKFIQNMDPIKMNYLNSKIIFHLGVRHTDWQYFDDFIDYPVLFRCFYSQSINSYFTDRLDYFYNRNSGIHHPVIQKNLIKLLQNYRDLISAPLWEYVYFYIGRGHDIYSYTLLKHDSFVDTYLKELVIELSRYDVFLKDFIKKTPKTFRFIIDKINHNYFRDLNSNFGTNIFDQNGTSSHNEFEINKSFYDDEIYSWFTLFLDEFDKNESQSLCNLIYIFDLQNKNSFTFKYKTLLSKSNQMKITFYDSP